jgi:hypothetical protein
VPSLWGQPRQSSMSAYGGNMNPNDKAFVELCAELIKLGARTVKRGEYEATFVPVPKVGQRPTPEVDWSDPSDRFPRSR